MPSARSCIATPYAYGVMMTAKLRSLIPRQQFEVPIQAAIGSRVIARETIRAIPQRRAGQVLRRRHQPQTQTVGKAEKRARSVKMVGRVEVPQEAFIAALSTSEEPR